MKNKKNKRKFSNVIVKFYPCSDETVKEYLENLGLEGIRVGSLINRWAVDVPFWKQNHFSNKLLENENLVEKVYVTKYEKRKDLEEDE